MNCFRQMNFVRSDRVVHPSLAVRLSQCSVAYPLGDLSTREKQALLLALCAAWSRVVNSGAVLADEDTITTLMIEELRAIRTERSIPGYAPSTFETPVRDAKEVNYCGSRPDKMPDIAFRPTGELDARRGWFVEAKIVDRTHSVADYIKKGVNRFIDGDYAWAMPSAAMICYNHHSYAIDVKLKAKLSPAISSLHTSARETKHRRAFLYLGNNAPGDIQLVHLWLR